MTLDVLVEEVGEKVNVGKQSEFWKTEVIGKVEGQYPKFFKFEFVQGNADVPENLIEGTYARIHFAMEGKKVESKKKGEAPNYFVTLQGWKVEPVE